MQAHACSAVHPFSFNQGASCVSVAQRPKSHSHKLRATAATARFARGLFSSLLRHFVSRPWRLSRECLPAINVCREREEQTKYFVRAASLSECVRGCSLSTQKGSANIKMILHLLSRVAIKGERAIGGDGENNWLLLVLTFNPLVIGCRASISFPL